MKALEEVDFLLKRRARELEVFRDEGRKIIGYSPGGYLPVEVIGSFRDCPFSKRREGLIPCCLKARSLIRKEGV